MGIQYEVIAANEPDQTAHLLTIDENIWVHQMDLSPEREVEVLLETQDKFIASLA